MMPRIHLEYPERELIEAPHVKVLGWCTSDAADVPLTIYLNGRVLPHTVTDRPDVRRVFPEQESFGFMCWLTPEEYFASGGELELRFEHGTTTLQKSFRYSDAARLASREWERQRAAKRAWCREALQCPMCRRGRPIGEPSGALACACGARFEQATGALNLLPEELYRRFGLRHTDNVSSHNYPHEAVALIEAVRKTGGKVLDCGAGLRSVQDQTVVNLDICDYPSTDVLAVGQSLPFADASFDLVLSLSVLEHVDDPFACAEELARVVKPDGKIFCVAPFLIPEHGYPNHFFNMSRQGLVRLFEGKARLLSHEVPRYGVPMYMLCAFVDEYLEGLSAPLRAEFEAVTIGELAKLRRDEYWGKSYVRELSEEASWRLAAVTAAVFQRGGV